MPKLIAVVLLVAALAASACGVVFFGDLTPLRVQIVNRTQWDLVVRPARPNELRWRVDGPNQPVTLAPGESITRRWGPDYDHRLQGTDLVTIEADNAQGIVIFCRRFAVNDLLRQHETVEIRDVDLACE
jgi:hypothetical protein